MSLRNLWTECATSSTLNVDLTLRVRTHTQHTTHTHNTHTHTHTHTYTHTTTHTCAQTHTNTNTHVSKDTGHSQWSTWEKHVEHFVKEQNKLEQLNLHFLLSTLCRAHCYSSIVISRHSVLSPLCIVLLSVTFLIIVHFLSLSSSFSSGIKPCVPK